MRFSSVAARKMEEGSRNNKDPPVTSHSMSHPKKKANNNNNNENAENALFQLLDTDTYSPTHEENGESDDDASLNLAKLLEEDDNNNTSTSTFDMARRHFLEDKSRGGIHPNPLLVPNNVGSHASYTDGTNHNSKTRNRNTTVAGEFEREYRSVRWFKAALVSLLLVLTTVATGLFYWYSTKNETETFETEFKNLALKVKTSVERNMDMKQWTARTLSGVFSAHQEAAHLDAIVHLRDWPNVTVTSFESQTKAMHQLCANSVIGFSPLVTTQTREAWEAYATDHYDAMAKLMETTNDDVVYLDRTRNRLLTSWKKDETNKRSLLRHNTPTKISSPPPPPRALVEEFEKHHVDELFSFHSDTPRHEETTTTSSSTSSISHDVRKHRIYKVISNAHGTDWVDDTDPGPYLPLWQISPFEPNKGLVFYNQRSEAKRKWAIDTMIAFQSTTLTELILDQEPALLYPPNNPNNGPTSILYDPVLNHERTAVIGATSILFPWRDFFTDVLPPETCGLICVVEVSNTSNGRNQSFTYQINEDKAIFIGEGNIHDRKFSRREIIIKLPLSKTREENTRNDPPMTDDSISRPDPSQQDHAFHPRDGAHYTLKIYPSDLFQAKYKSKEPEQFAFMIALVFLFTTATLLIYDCLVERRQKAILKRAERSHKIVDNLFPAVVRDRLFQSNDETQKTGDGGMMDHSEHAKNGSHVAIRRGSLGKMSSMGKMMRRASNKSDQSTPSTTVSPPIADLFTDTTVLFADIAGFTAWSSEREPTQVFQLLEALFQEFDMESQKLGIFKVETIGDCYVAVAGVPTSRPDHACVMAKFALKCLYAFNNLTNELELTLGPGTAALGMRFGLHSGPVTGGVLRGDKSRFQLFGDTMNTASRMESTSKANMIQVSQRTANLLMAADKFCSIVARDDLVEAKGKGTMQTYWIFPNSNGRRMSMSNSKVQHFNSQSTLGFRDESNHSSSDDTRSEHQGSANENQSFRSRGGRPSLLRRTSLSSFSEASSWKLTGNEVMEASRMQPNKLMQRLISWNSAMLEKRLVKVLVHREGQPKTMRRRLSRRLSARKSLEQINPLELLNSLEESNHDVAEAITFPTYNDGAANHYHDLEFSSRGDSNSRHISPEARGELFEFVTRIASMYRNTHFHNFEHASHVSMSANKLMNKVCFFDVNMDLETQGGNHGVRSFFSSFGICYDPLVQLAVVFAALVHDVDHTGVPNVVRMEENPELATKYKGKSLAENNSIDLAWNLLMEPDFENLRKIMFADAQDRDRFHQLLVNLLIATDIADNERRAKEKERWTKAFSTIFKWEDHWQNKSVATLSSIDVSLRATVVLEQIMLASDVAHTMQHWLTFVKWNERLYREVWSAYASGRTGTDSTLGWYEGQISFFDGYIIPLASKLKDSGVFGSAGAEYLGNALNNREEWIEKGKEISAQFDELIKNGPVDDAPNYWTNR